MQCTGNLRFTLGQPLFTGQRVYRGDFCDPRLGTRTYKPSQVHLLKENGALAQDLLGALRFCPFLGDLEGPMELKLTRDYGDFCCRYINKILTMLQSGKGSQRCGGGGELNIKFAVIGR